MPYTGYIPWRSTHMPGGVGSMCRSRSQILLAASPAGCSVATEGLLLLLRAWCMKAEEQGHTGEFPWGHRSYAP